MNGIHIFGNMEITLLTILIFQVAIVFDFLGRKYRTSQLTSDGVNTGGLVNKFTGLSKYSFASLVFWLLSAVMFIHNWQLPFFKGIIVSILLFVILKITTFFLSKK